MKKAVLLLSYFMVVNLANGQNDKYDSLKDLLASAKDDSTQFDLLSKLSMQYLWNYPDSSVPYMQQSIVLAKKMNSTSFLGSAYSEYGWYFNIVGDYTQALYFWQEALRLAEKSGNKLRIARCYDQLTVVYIDEGDYRRALSLEEKAMSILQSKWKPPFGKDVDPQVNGIYAGIYNGLASCYTMLNEFDSALVMAKKCDDFARARSGKGWSAASFLMGNIYLNTRDYKKALQFYRTGISQAKEDQNGKDLMDNCIGLAKTFKSTGQLDSSIFYAAYTLDVSKSAHNSITKLAALQLLSDIYQMKGNSDSTVKYLQLTIATKDSMFSHRKVVQIRNMTFNEEQRHQKILDEQQQYRNKIKTYVLSGGLISLLAISVLLYRNNRQKQKARLRVENAYATLKSTQAQLIQSEKMASLGELTAGIAHEIQNPLNFVNNFSEVNEELLTEMKDEMTKGNIENALALASDAIENQKKINHHGERADVIVKGMLQHSRSGGGVKEPTDINALADEYLRLAYHGLRAKDKSFNATLKTDFDENVGNINIIPQDIGRVILNLVNNAFYAASLPSKGGFSDSDNSKTPTVWVSTKKENNKILISVRDNGPGIPTNILDKIFQPFFTTKPTGQGTGLGLSLAYDIVKAHGGVLKVETREGEGSEFVIQLPVG